MMWRILMLSVALTACAPAAPKSEPAALPIAAATDDIIETATVVTPAPDMTALEPAGGSPAVAVETAEIPQPQTRLVSQPADVAARDERLVGIWVNENIISSGGGNFASYMTVMTMELYPDGRVVQYTESVGGGGDWSFDGGRSLDFDGQWRADGQTLYVYAAPLPDFTPAATYTFSGEHLVTVSDMGRLIWQRRG